MSIFCCEAAGKPANLAETRIKGRVNCSGIIEKKKNSGKEKDMAEKSNKVVITVVGKDTVGIIGKVCTVLASHGINILDISQTIVSGYLNMMMVVDMATSDVSFSECQKALDAAGEDIGVEIHSQREEIFDMMHQV